MSHERALCAAGATGGVFPAGAGPAALLAGADLVLELPVTVSLRSAEGFAGGAVEILDRVGG